MNRKGKIKRFRWFIGFSLLIHLAALCITLTLLFVWLETTHSTILYFRALMLPRILFLSATLCWPVGRIEFLIGVNEKILRAWSYIPPLWAWLLIGRVDWYLLRWTIPIVNIFWFLFKGPIDTLQFLAFFIHDIFYLVDYVGTFYLIHRLGIPHSK